MGFAHLGHLVAYFRSEAKRSEAHCASSADVSVATLQLFERTGTGLSPQRIGMIVDSLGIDRDHLTELDDPLSAIGTLWGPDLAELIRSRRGDRKLATVAAAGDMDTNTLRRWENALTHPRDREQLSALLTYLGIDAVEAVKYALWPPLSQMTERPPLGERLLQRRTQLNLTTRAAAKLIGVGESTYHPWERGRSNPSDDSLAKLAVFLEISVAEARKLVPPRRVDTFGLNEFATTLVKNRLGSFTKLEDVADESGVSVSTIRHYERGATRPAPKLIPKLADAIGVDAVTLAFTQLGFDRSTATLGQTLKAVRLASGKTARDAASPLGCSHTQLSNWEADLALPRPARLDQLINDAASLFNIDIAELRQASARTAVRKDPFAVWLGAAMATASHTNSTLAKALGVRGSDVNAWTKSHSRPGLRHAQHLAAALGVEVQVISDQLAAPRR